LLDMDTKLSQKLKHDSPQVGPCFADVMYY